MKRVAISQSNYIPWKGYFDMIASVDEFVIYDDMQYTRRDWRNRNKIKAPNGLIWLTIPVSVKGKYTQKINETLISDQDWAQSHWKSIALNYRRAPCFSEIAVWLEPLYLELDEDSLSGVNRRFIEALCHYLEIDTRLTSSQDYRLVEGKTERLADICAQAGADRYVSGPAARDYIDAEIFESGGIGLEWFNYEGFREYPQLWGDFEHGVSILDLLLNCGSESRKYLRSSG